MYDAVVQANYMYHRELVAALMHGPRTKPNP